MSDLRAMKGLRQRNGGPLSELRARWLLELGLVRYREDVTETYPDRPPHYSLTTDGDRVLGESIRKGRA
jgi:hypothetical protein